MADGEGRRVPSARGQKSKLMDWANDQQQLDMRTKYILKELASYADAECCAWSKVETLAYAANCSERTVQYHLARLREAGLIAETGRAHRLDQTTRSVPIYSLAPDVEGLGKPESMGAKVAPIDGAWVQSAAGMGAKGLHPQGDHGDQESSDELSPGERARDARVSVDLLRSIEQAIPPRMLRVSDRTEYIPALHDLAQSESLEVLPGCLRRWAEDPLFVGKKVPIPLEKWLRSGMWRGSLPEPEPAPVAADAGPDWAAEPGAFAVWIAVMAEMQVALGATSFGSYLGPAALGQIGSGEGGQLFVVMRNGVARDWLRDAGRFGTLQAAWARRDERALTLISKSDFEARLRQTGSEGG